MKKKSNIMSLSIDLEIQERLKTVATKRNISVSKLIRDLVDKQLSTNTEEDVDTVIFKIPNSAKVSEQDLRTWFEARVNSVVKALIVAK